MIAFPLKNNQRYWKIHYEYILNIFKYLKYPIEYKENLEIDDLSFKCIFEGKEIVFDYSDDSNFRNLPNNIPIFKFHYSSLINYPKNYVPFTPVSFQNWGQFYSLEKEIKYKAKGYVVNRQTPYGNAFERRNKVRELLRNSGVEHNLLFQEEFWKDINNISMIICVPGQNNNMLDRGQLQCMAFGTCTISPNLPEILSFNKKIIPQIHYLRCNEDYSDLILQLGAFNVYFRGEENNKYIQIGQEAKKLFLETSVPEKLVEWVKGNI